MQASEKHATNLWSAGVEQVTGAKRQPLFYVCQITKLPSRQLTHLDLQFWKGDQYKRDEFQSNEIKTLARSISSEKAPQVKYFCLRLPIESPYAHN